jgi:predicted nucleic acid-binding protein
MTLHESPTHLRTLRSLVVDGRATGGALHDARIAALFLDHGVSELLTADRDFSRFPALRVRNPLIDRR